MRVAVVVPILLVLLAFARPLPSAGDPIRLQPADPERAFGVAVDASPDVLLIGAATAAYVFRRDGTEWVEEARLPVPELFAYVVFTDVTSVALAGDVAVIGAAFDEELGREAGAAYVYRYDGTGWALEAKLVASDGGELQFFGGSVDAWGDAIVVGARQADGAHGAAYVYRHDGSSWVEEAKLERPSRASGNFFGESVAIFGNRILVGHPGHEPCTGSLCTDRGIAHLFQRSGGNWTLEALLDPGNDPLDEVGTFVDLQGDLALVGGPRYTRVYRLDRTSWLEEAELRGGQGAILGDTVVVGSAVFLRDGDGWPHVANVARGDVALSEDFALVGALVYTRECQDGLDNDEDGVADALDPGCASVDDFSELDPLVPCDDGGDNDSDRLVDWPDDPGCRGLDDPLESDPTLACDNGDDDDGDGLTDLRDIGCSGPDDPDGSESDSTGTWICDDGIDNDGDGWTDFRTGGGDPVCASSWYPREDSPCQDGIDNDLDGRVDFDGGASVHGAPVAAPDPVCQGPAFTREDSLCQDGIDNDLDGRLDFDGGASIHGAPVGPPDPECVEWSYHDGYCGCAIIWCTCHEPRWTRTDERDPGRDSEAPPECGDGVLDVYEACDDGNDVAGDGCSPGCTLETCGDGVIQEPEACDDANTSRGDGCRPDCTVEMCGDGMLDPGEECDDGQDGSAGCRPDCTFVLPPGACALVQESGCIAAGKAKLTVDEKRPGHEKLTAVLSAFEGATSVADLGDPVTGGTAYDLCLYEPGGRLVVGLGVDRAGGSCGPAAKPCWKEKRDNGFRYDDADAESSGVRRITAVSGPAGRGRIVLRAKNHEEKGRTGVPSGIASSLQATAAATLQVLTSDAACFEATLDTVKKADGATWKAKLR